MISRKDILSQVNTYDIMAHFLKDYYEMEQQPIEEGVHIYVPEVSGKQKTPSFNIYQSKKSGEWRYKDFTGNDGSAFDLVMKLFGVSFSKAIKIINQDMQLGLEDKKIDYKKVKPKPEYRVAVERNYTYNLVTGKWTKKRLEFWSRYGVGIDTLDKYNIRPLETLSYFNKYNVPKEIKSGSDSLIFCWEYDSWGKYYLPKIDGVQKKGFGYFGKKADDYVFGLEQLPETGDELYLVAGEKDTLSMSAHGHNAVCLSSEEAVPSNSPKFMSLLESKRFKKHYILYDADETGTRRMMEIHSEIPELVPKIIDLPEGWDISDHLRAKYNKYLF